MPAWSTNTNLTHRVPSGNGRAMSSLASRSACIAPPKTWLNTFPYRDDTPNISRFGLSVHRVRLPLTLRTGVAPCRKTLLGHQPLSGPSRSGATDEREDDPDYDPERGDDRVPRPRVRRIRVHVAQ